MTPQSLPVPSPVLSVEHLTLMAGDVPLVEDVSLTIGAGEMLGLVGESGCGKSVTALSILRLLPEPAIRIAGGRIRFGGEDLATLAPADLARVRGAGIGMIFQEPMTSLNPVFTVGEQIAEPLRLHRGLDRRAALHRAGELLDLVGVHNPSQALARYPHQLSGGQRQRVMIAIAISCEPKLLIADEPTTALDVTVQAQVLRLIRSLSERLGLACLLITHDLGVVSEICDRAMVMYAGRIVEEGPLPGLFAAPRHRYTEALIATAPSANPPGRRLPAIPGQVPQPGARGAGCAFAERCAAALALCAHERPLWAVAGNGAVACWNPA
jgi:oligopeptide/dipeptide ABC transporter ATP-binding protein